MIMLDQDILTIDPDYIMDINVERTWLAVNWFTNANDQETEYFPKGFH